MEEFRILKKRQLHIAVSGRVGDFLIKGVTFENRQETILTLKRGKMLPLGPATVESIFSTQGRVPYSDHVLLLHGSCLAFTRTGHSIILWLQYLPMTAPPIVQGRL